MFPKISIQFLNIYVSFIRSRGLWGFKHLSSGEHTCTLKSLRERTAAQRALK